MSKAGIETGCREELLQEKKPRPSPRGQKLHFSAGSFCIGPAGVVQNRKGKQKFGNKKSMVIISKSIKFCLIKSVHFYRAVVRPWIPCCCKYEPTCSEYALLCLDLFPLHRAMIKILRRLIFCNPFCKGGVDYPNH